MLKMKTTLFCSHFWIKQYTDYIFSFCLLAICFLFVITDLSMLQSIAKQTGVGMASFCFKAVKFKLHQLSPFYSHSLQLLIIKIRLFYMNKSYCVECQTVQVPSRIMLSIQFMDVCYFVSLFVSFFQIMYLEGKIHLIYSQTKINDVTSQQKPIPVIFVPSFVHISKILGIHAKLFKSSSCKGQRKKKKKCAVLEITVKKVTICCSVTSMFKNQWCSTDE